jgi:UDP-N-acetylmuramyl pentapeptide phosphotransferase/UDP-N-acetylglucosamine-1-phosphate transferase
LETEATFDAVPAVGLFFATLFCEAFASLGAALTVRAWNGHVGVDGLLVGLLSCVAAIVCGVIAFRAAHRMEGRWAGGIVAAATTLIWVFELETLGGLGG